MLRLVSRFERDEAEKYVEESLHLIDEGRHKHGEETPSVKV